MLNLKEKWDNVMQCRYFYSIFQIKCKVRTSSQRFISGRKFSSSISTLLLGRLVILQQCCALGKTSTSPPMYSERASAAAGIIRQEDNCLRTFRPECAKERTRAFQLDPRTAQQRRGRSKWPWVPLTWLCLWFSAIFFSYFCEKKLQKWVGCACVQEWLFIF